MVEEFFEIFREWASITRRRKVSKKLTPIRVPDPVLKENVELLDRRSHLCDQLTEEKNRLQHCSTRIAQSIGTMIRYVQNELDQIEREIRRVVPNARSKHRIRFSNRLKVLERSAQGLC